MIRRVRKGDINIHSQIPQMLQDWRPQIQNKLLPVVESRPINVQLGILELVCKKGFTVVH